MRIAVINQKGGVAKTTTAANLGAALAQNYGSMPSVPPQSGPASGNAAKMRPNSKKNPKLRLIDLDPQGSLLRYRKSIKGAVFHAPHADELRALLEEDAPSVVDCPPGLDDATRDLLLAHTDIVLIPLQPAYDALIGMVRTIETVEAAQATNPRLSFKVLLTMYRGRPSARQIRDDVQAAYPDNVCKAIIPYSLVFEETAALAQPVLSHAPDSTAARAYLKLAKESLTWQ